MLGRKLFYEFWYKMYKMSLKGMNIGNSAGDVKKSGEYNVFRLVKGTKSKKKVLFDIGANRREYTKALLQNFPDAQIHSFEPARETYKTLKKNVRAENVKLNNFGISNEISESILYYDKENSGWASLYNRQLDYFGVDFSKSETVRLDTLDHYCRENNVRHIDLLKLDIEGNELNALKGATELLAEKRIKVIQIEFGGCNIDSRVFFRDFWNLLHEDFRMCRILRDGFKEILQYDERLENFATTNYVFILKK